MRTAFGLLLSGLAPVALLPGCGGGVSPNASEVRLVNATNEFGTLDLYESSDRLTARDAPFAAGKYEELDDGDHTFSVRGGVAGRRSRRWPKTRTQPACCRVSPAPV